MRSYYISKLLIVLTQNYLYIIHRKLNLIKNLRRNKFNEKLFYYELDLH
jgi:hypothetical protein